MSDALFSPESLQVDPDLRRRVAWGLLAGRSKAQIAAAEEISEEDCRIVCAASGMFAIANVWANFLERRCLGGRRNLRKLTGWCVEHVFRHAPERLNRNELWRLDRLSAVMLDYGFAVVFGWMLGFLDGVMAVPGARRRDLGDFRQNLVDLLCWAVEVTFQDRLAEQFPADYLAAKDAAFSRAIADAEIFELGQSGRLRTIEDVIREHAEAAALQSAEGGAGDSSLTTEVDDAADLPSPSESEADVVTAVGDVGADTASREGPRAAQARVARARRARRPAMTRRGPGHSPISSSCPAAESAVRARGRPRRGTSGRAPPWRIRPRMGPGAKVPIRPPPRRMADRGRRCSRPPLLRDSSSERAA